jgi:inosine/xanthosine triphosphatase
MKIAVGSTNPVKIEAVKEAFQAAYPDEAIEVRGYPVPSGVSDQPMSDMESIDGATHRANEALKVGGADYGVGLEGGIQLIGNKWFDCGWVVILSKEGEAGIASSVRIETPGKMMAFIHQGKELGEVVDILSGQRNTKQAGGHFGFMTNGIIDRKEGYRQAAVMALARFLHSELWE